MLSLLCFFRGLSDWLARLPCQSPWIRVDNNGNLVSRFECDPGEGEGDCGVVYDVDHDGKPIFRYERRAPLPSGCPRVHDVDDDGNLVTRIVCIDQPSAGWNHQCKRYNHNHSFEFNN